VSDRALFRLGEACAQAKAWDQSRNAFEALVNRYPQSPWCESARYGVGWALQNQRQFDAAVANYREVARRNNGEVSLKAQLQMGLCLLEQKRATEAAKLFQHLVQEHPDTPWADQARQRLAEIR
jgi:outer membrane protein assembly factor BamD (BamD/ComL family)